MSPTIIPDFVKIGFEIMAVTLTKTKLDSDLKGRAVKSVMAKLNIILCAKAECIGKNGMFISFHKITDIIPISSQDT